EPGFISFGQTVGAGFLFVLFCFDFEIGSCYVVPHGLQILDSNNPPASASQVAGTGSHHHWKSTCLACTRPWVPFPEPKNKKKKKEKKKDLSPLRN
uniref:Uncharacterized protein n=1 Tax=Marmota marmota marmota TaxID=9994 RepID=A0A8C6ACC1_MARMA